MEIRRWIGLADATRINAPGNWDPVGSPAEGDVLLFDEYARADVPAGQVLPGVLITVAKAFHDAGFNIGRIDADATVP